MKRRNFLRAAGGLTTGCLLCSSGIALPSGGGPADRPEKPIPESESRQRRGVDGKDSIRKQIGCALKAGSKDDLQTNLDLSPGSNMPQLDQLIYLEANFMAADFGVRPAFFFYNDNKAKNAFATTEVFDPKFIDGSVVFGASLLEDEIRSNPPGIGVVAIMAHEWGHIRQFREGIRSSGRGLELHADLLAGWYVGLKNARRPNDPLVHPAGAWRSVFSKGDYQFNSPSHHGTPSERGNAFVKGFQMAASRTDLNSTFNFGRAIFNI